MFLLLLPYTGCDAAVEIWFQGNQADVQATILWRSPTETRNVIRQGENDTPKVSP
jgi:hypothetical protein